MEAPHTMNSLSDLKGGIAEALNSTNGRKSTRNSSSKSLEGAEGETEQGEEQGEEEVEDWGGMDVKSVPSCCLKKIADSNGQLYKVPTQGRIEGSEETEVFPPPHRWYPHVCCRAFAG